MRGSHSAARPRVPISPFTTIRGFAERFPRSAGPPLCGPTISRTTVFRCRSASPALAAGNGALPLHQQAAPRRWNRWAGPEVCTLPVCGPATRHSGELGANEREMVSERICTRRFAGPPPLTCSRPLDLLPALWYYWNGERRSVPPRPAPPAPPCPVHRDGQSSECLEQPWKRVGKEAGMSAPEGHTTQVVWVKPLIEGHRQHTVSAEIYTVSCWQRGLGLHHWCRKVVWGSATSGIVKYTIRDVA